MPEHTQHQQHQTQDRQTIHVVQAPPKSNGMGITGFVLSLIAIFTGWIPILGWIVWFLGLIFSFIGVFRKPRGLAIAGLIISLIGVILLIFVFGVIIAAAGMGGAMQSM